MIELAPSVSAKGRRPGRRPQVLLINPRTGSPRSIHLPLSILALGAAIDGSYGCQLLDGNLLQAAMPEHVSAALANPDLRAIGITVMPGPQVASAIAVSKFVRAARPGLPVVWGGYFPTLYPDAAINADYVDFLVRGQGEDTLCELLAVLTAAPTAAHARSLESISGLTWKSGGRAAHNADRAFRSPDAYPPLPYHLLGKVEDFLRPTFLGRRTAQHQAAIGCRYRCRFCGVVSMFNGTTQAPGPDRLAGDLRILRDRYGVDSMQYVDNNFFDTEPASRALLDVLAAHPMPYWCYARADALAGFSADTWSRIRRSALRMAYIGAETANDSVLKGMSKGTKVDHTLEVAHRCKENGVVPEFSFILGGPEDPEDDIERTFRFIRRLKAITPNCEVILYFYSPVPQRGPTVRHHGVLAARLPRLAAYGPAGPALPTTPDEWAQPHWVDYVCHRDAPWLTPRVRRKVEDFARVLACRFPTVQDSHTPAWAKRGLRMLSSWRYASGVYSRSWELEWARRLVALRDPAAESI